MSKRAPSRPESKPRHRRQQARAGAIANAYVVRGAGTKHGPGRNQFGPVEFAQVALRNIPDYQKLSTRQREAALNDWLVQQPGFRSRYGNKKIHRTTIERAMKVLATLDH